MKKSNHRQENAKRIMKNAGYSKGGSDDSGASEFSDPHDKKLAKDLSPSKTQKAGYVNGGAPKKRLDKPSRVAAPVQLARGGAAKKEGKTQVNVIITGKGEDGASPAPAMMPPRPPMAAPAPAMPPQGMPPKPPGMMNKGGAVKMDAGAGGGKGRLEKAKEYGGKPLKRGGKCDK